MSQVKDAIYYFEEQGFLEELTGDKKFYTKELIAEVKKLRLQITELSIEIDNLSYENKAMAYTLEELGYNVDNVIFKYKE